MFYSWKNRPDSYQYENEIVTICAPGETDFFNDPKSSLRKSDAPFFSREVTGDFTVQGRVKPDFRGTFDAGTLMFYCDDYSWVKLAFEQTDMGCRSIVSVVTREISDDANGEVVTEEGVFLKMSRRGDVIGLYYSLDGTNWRMVRVLSFPVPVGSVCFLGVSAQSPRGSGCEVSFSHLEFLTRPVEDFRKGV